ncbi:hypothetical protein [Pseudonocardia sp. GCM10023141]|uniref:hypothetical protein n=1 Tax=Pseudonocardia sp. GCM10023141 TaxID=3252653 RepID=UPI00361FB322
MRRRSARMYSRQPRRPTPLPPLLLLIFVVMVVPAVGSIGAGFIGIAIAGAFITAMIMPVLVVGAGVYAVNQRQRRRALRRGAAGTAPLPARPAAPPRPDLVWVAARQRFYALRGEYAAFECDTMQVLRLPALADVSVPSTARFVDAFAEAQALETDAYPHDPHGAQFVAAADKAERAWRAARDAAERIRLSGLSPAERGTVERVIKLLTTARDSDSDPERLAAYARARSELAKLDRAGVIHLPRTAQAALDNAAQGALPPARETA